MFCRSFSWFICLFVVVVTATNYSDPEFSTGSNAEVTDYSLTIDNTGSNAEVTDYSLTTDNAESSTLEPVQDVKKTTAVDLGALLDAGDGTIVTMVSGDTRLVAHVAVLAARSHVFAEMFHNDTVEAGSSRQVAMPDVEGPVLRQLLAYMYSQQAPQLPSMAPQLLAAADRYGLPVLKADCERQLAAQLTVENAVTTAILAVKHSCNSLRQVAVAFIKAHIFHVMASQGWVDAMHSQPEDLNELSQLLSEPPADSRCLSRKDEGRKLIEAAKEGAAKELQSLLAAGADADARDGQGWTALHWAAREGHLEAVRSLLEGGAHVDARNSYQNTPLHFAAWGGHAAVVRLLMTSSADPNARNQFGWTPLHWAAKFGHAEVAAELLRAGAERSPWAKMGSLPLDLAKQNNHPQLIQMLR